MEGEVELEGFTGEVEKNCGEGSTLGGEIGEVGEEEFSCREVGGANEEFTGLGEKMVGRMV